MMMQFNNITYNPNLISMAYRESMISQMNLLLNKFTSCVFLNKPAVENITISAYMKYQVVRFIGEIDLSSSAQIRKRILWLLKEGTSLLIDFSDLTYIDCSGIAVLVEALNIAKSSGSSMTIIGATGSPLQMLQLTRLNQVFTLYNSYEELEYHESNITQDDSDTK